MYSSRYAHDKQEKIDQKLARKFLDVKKKCVVFAEEF